MVSPDCRPVPFPASEPVLAVSQRPGNGRGGRRFRPQTVSNVTTTVCRFCCTSLLCVWQRFIVLRSI